VRGESDFAAHSCVGGGVADGGFLSNAYQERHTIMGTRRNKKLLDSAAPLMTQDEQVELVAMAKLGSTGAVAATTVTVGVAAGVLAAALGGGAGFVGFAQRSVYILLTSRQVLFFETLQSTGGPGKHLASFDRTRVSVDEPRGSVFVKFRFMAEGMTEPLLLTYPPIPPSIRKQGLLLAAALPRPTA